MAIAAEAGGLLWLWAIDRVLVPVNPRSAYPTRADGTLPPEQRTAIDPIVALSVAATVTDRIRLGTSVLVAPWYPPVLLARALASVDVAGVGRLTVGLGVGWSLDEYEAVGATMQQRGRRLDEILELLNWLWSGRTQRVTDQERIEPASLTVRPAQHPRPPILLAAYRWRPPSPRPRPARARADRSRRTYLQRRRARTDASAVHRVVATDRRRRRAHSRPRCARTDHRPASPGDPPDELVDIALELAAGAITTIVALTTAATTPARSASAPTVPPPCSQRL